jgi:hypothetical protein
VLEEADRSDDHEGGGASGLDFGKSRPSAARQVLGKSRAEEESARKDRERQGSVLAGENAQQTRAR